VRTFAAAVYMEIKVFALFYPKSQEREYLAGPGVKGGGANGKRVHQQIVKSM